jgi:hypothetical protein
MTMSECNVCDNDKGLTCAMCLMKITVIHRLSQMESDCLAVQQFLGSMVMPHLAEDIDHAIRKAWEARNDT